ncbi:MAG: methyltransferase domain-containing protein [Clostridia bacterium]|nr:methyltransferase domain-containing protein [Clostridia bacterium]MBQ8235923.1 methyltransferase domain-containing protein [Clostridia bacterium]MBQ8398820.1 methyltransferase domain-containing protein [Clostridia bacterium]
MVDLLELHKYFLSSHLKEGGVAADFTMGNGNDTLWLSRQVGESGHVYAFDVQAQALKNTAKRLREENAPKNCTLILDSHSNLKTYIKRPLCAGMFNLGYLPGSNKVRTTRRPTTKKAVCDAIDMLAPGGGLLIAVYPGHEEGFLEGEMLRATLSEYSRFRYSVSEFHIINSPTSPFFFLVEKSERTEFKEPGAKVNASAQKKG